MGKNHLRIAEKLELNIKCLHDIQLKDSSYENFLKCCKNLDGVIIASSTKTHTKILFDILSINDKIKILCEKPISHSTEDKYLTDLIKYKNNILMGQVERFNPVVLTLKDLTKNQKIIQIKTTRISNTASREIIDVKKDIGIHDLDVCCYILNLNKIENIKINSIGDKGNFSHEILTYNIDKTFVFNEVSWIYPYKLRTIEILTDREVYRGNYFSQEIIHIDSTGLENKVYLQKIEPLYNEIVHFCDMIKNNCEPISNIVDNIELLRILGY